MTPVRKHIIVGCICAIIGISVSFLRVGEIVELKGYDLLHLFRKPQKPPADIVIVAVDEPSFTEIGKQWPWPRSLHAKLVDVLKAEGASVIGFDISFYEPSQVDEDVTLAHSLGKAGNVCLAAEIDVIRRENYDQRKLVEPIPVLKDNSFNGIVNVIQDWDNVVRKYFTVEEHEILFAKQMARLHVKKESEIKKNSYVSYVGPPDSFKTVSYYQALEPSQYLPKDFFRGKIVIVGQQLKTSQEIQRESKDYFATPFLFAQNAGLMSGVELQANMVQNFLTGAFVVRLNWFWKILLFFMIGIMGSFIQIRWKPLLSGLLTFFFIFGYLITSYYLFRNNRLWIPTFLMIVPLSINYGIFGILAYVETEKKRREIRQAFSHYLSPSVLKAILENPDKLKLGGETVEATVLFSDIAGFTSISEKLSPEDVSRFLNRYFDEMTRIIFQYNGTIDKFVGDGLIAFWGAPVRDPAHSLNACRAAIRMQERLRDLRPEMKTERMPEISIRIGINTGMVIAGNMGSSELFSYTVIGDTVNLASRLEAANKDTGTSILISKAVYERVAVSADVRPLGRLRVKGKTEEIEVFELLDVTGDARNAVN